MYAVDCSPDGIDTADLETTFTMEAAIDHIGDVTATFSNIASGSIVGQTLTYNLGVYSDYANMGLQGGLFSSDSFANAHSILFDNFSHTGCSKSGM
jgi:hypothetical protein